MRRGTERNFSDMKSFLRPPGDLNINYDSCIVSQSFARFAHFTIQLLWAWINFSHADHLTTVDTCFSINCINLANLLRWLVHETDSFRLRIPRPTNLSPFQNRRLYQKSLNLKNIENGNRIRKYLWRRLIFIFHRQTQDSGLRRKCAKNETKIFFGLRAVYEHGPLFWLIKECFRPSLWLPLHAKRARVTKGQIERSCHIRENHLNFSRNFHSRFNRWKCRVLLRIWLGRDFQSSTPLKLQTNLL